MEMRRLGKQGLTVSAQGLGCMSMGDVYGPADEGESIATIHRALELGVNFFDTADVYGPLKSEEILGRAIAGRRNEVVIGTKFGLNFHDRIHGPVRGDPEYVRESCEGSLRRLGTDYIDLYYLHRADQKTPIEDTVGAMAELVAAGKVRYIGLSEVASETLRRAQATAPISAIQNEWSLWSRDIEDEALSTARELGIGIVAYSPLGRGFLTGQIKRQEDLAQNDWRNSVPRFQGENLQRNLAIVERVRELAVERGVTPGQLALAWVQSRDGDVVPIPGCKTRGHLEENVAALDIKLSEEDLRRIEEVAPKGSFAGERYADMRYVGGVTPPRG
jgi:aryl-alcohol dehydrogenase-like predicted oxidoreductase